MTFIFNNGLVYFKIYRHYFFIMEKRFEVLLNKALREYREVLYGYDSDIIVEKIEWIKSKKSYLITIKILTSKIEESLEIHPDGINTMVDLAWSVIGYKNKIIVISSLDIK